MDGFNKWLSGWMDTPGGSLIIPLAVVLGRCLATAIAAKMERKKRKKHKHKTAAAN